MKKKELEKTIDNYVKTKQKFVYFDSRKISSLPESIGKLRSLIGLFLARNNLTSLPKTFGQLKKLEELDLMSNKLSTLPENFGDLAQLKILNLSANTLSDLPESFGKLINLEVLNLRKNNLTSLPESFGKLRNSKFLDLTDNNLSALPESFGGLKSLKILQISRNNLSSLPESFGDLTRLNAIGLEFNKLTSLPESFEKLESLDFIDLKYNKLTSLPESFGKLGSLRELNLGYNNLSVLPESFGDLTRLKSILLGNNVLSSLPESFGKLVLLNYLVLNWNYLTSLPESFGDLRSLEVLQIANNKLSSLPESFGDLRSLEVLQAERNNLTSLPESFGKLSNLRQITLDYNKLTSIPESFVRNFGSPTISNLSSLKKNETVQRLAKFVNFLREYESQNREAPGLKNKYKYQQYCEAKKEKSNNTEQIKKEILEYIEKNPNSKLLEYRTDKVKYTTEKRRPGVFTILREKGRPAKLSAEDVKNYEGSFLDESAKSYTREEIFEQFKDLVLTVFEMRKDKGQCGGIKESDIRTFLEGRFSKDQLCRYFSALEKIYILEMREQTRRCYNYDEDEGTFYTLMGEEIGDVPYKNLIMYDKNGITYCFTAQELKGFEGRNPYTREEIPGEVLALAAERQKYSSWLIPGRDYEKIAEELAKMDIKFGQQKLYSDLYDYMTRVEQIYPIDESSFKAKSPETIRDQFRTYASQEITEGLLPWAEVSRVLGSPPEVIHLEVVGALLKILRARDDGNLKSRILLIKQTGLF